MHDMNRNGVSCWLRFVIPLFVAMAASSCRQHDYQTRIFYLPGLKNEECAKLVSNVLSQQMQLPSMNDSMKPETIKFDFEKRTMTVEYDSMKTELKNIEHAIARAGFAVNEIPVDTNAVAKLPPECR